MNEQEFKTPTDKLVSSISYFREDKKIGFIKLKPINSWLVELEMFNVKKKYRNAGIGNILLQDAIKEIVKHNYGKISLLCRADAKAALHLYEKNGFEIEGELKNHFKNEENMYVISKLLNI